MKLAIGHFILLLLCLGCAVVHSPVSPPKPDLNPEHAITVIMQSFAQAAPETVLAPSAATIALLPASVDLVWTPSIDSDVNSYNVYWGTASGQYSNQLNVATAAATITGLVPLQNYYFAVTAVDASGEESGFSNELPVFTPQWVRLHFPEANITGIQSSPDLVHWVDRPDAVETNGDWMLTAQPQFVTTQ